MAGRYGEVEDEGFLGRSPNGEDSPTVQPLRISKSPTPSSARSYDPPPRTKPAFPLPPGASSSANPLPYPDDDDDFQYTPPKESRSNRPPYPDDDRSHTPGRGARESPLIPSSSPAARAGGNIRKASYDTTPRLATSPVENKGPRLGERRGAIPKPLPESPGPDLPDKEGLFARMPQRERQNSDTRHTEYPDRTLHQEYYPPPGSNVNGPAHHNHAAPQASSVNRFASSASTSTTRATRGSPPPPETPIVGPGGQFDDGIEARYAAAGIAGAGTLSGLQTRSAAATQRANQYGPPPVPQLPHSPGLSPQPRPWTPTESPDSNPHGPPTVYQGAAQVANSRQNASPHSRNGSGGSNNQTNTLEQDFARMQMSASPPPAYSSVHTPGANGSQGYPVEKRNTNVQTATVKPPTIASPLASPALQHPGHPAFANGPRQQQVTSPIPGQEQQPGPAQQFANTSPFQGGAGPLSPPPPLPEGWIAHIDQNSGQYYYIHLPTQHTQWDFPKGPTPLNLQHDTPSSPTLSTYGNPLASPGLSAFGKQGLGSPGYPPTPGYAESIMSMASQTPTAFTGPPPSAGVAMYKVAPTNGVYFGPYLRYINTDMERGVWLGSIMLVTDALQPPTIHIHQSIDLSPNPRQLKANPIFTHQRWTFYRYDIDLQMGEHGSDKWTYAITSHLGCTRYEFLVAGRYETNWRFIAHSGNDFALNTNANERSKLGGIGFMWKDILQKNIEIGGFHVQLGLGDQIFGDRIWKEIPLLKQWLAMSGKENRKTAAWTARHEEDVSHAYFHYYTSHFDQPHLREAFAQIPHILQIDDHDIFDGFGSYPDYMQSSNMFKNIGRIGIEMYLLFQHHTTLEILRNVNTDTDLFTITGAGWHFVKYLGPAVVVIGPDCRSERTQQQVMAGATYQGIFPKVATLPHSVQHCIWMISVPIVFPRLEAVESIANTFSTAKKGVTGTYNLLGKMTSSVAGVVGGKEVVASGFNQVKKAVGKSGLMGGVLNAFGDIDIADELRDMWTHDSKDLERTYLIRTLQGIAQQKGIRMTFLSGDVNVCGAGLLHDPNRDSDHKTMYQIISSSIVTAPPPSYVLKLLHNNKPLYIPQNGHRSKAGEITDTKEDMMEIFQTDSGGGVGGVGGAGGAGMGLGNGGGGGASGGSRDMKKLMGRRNYVAFVAYDPEMVAGLQSPNPAAAFYGGASSAGGVFGGNAGAGSVMYGRSGGAGSASASVHSGSGGGGYAERGVSRLSLAVDFVVQGDGTYNPPMKYGPVVIPNLEFGR